METGVDTWSLNAGVREIFQAWLESSPNGAKAAEERWRRTLWQGGFHFEGRAYPVALLPMILGYADVDAFSKAAPVILQLLEKVLEWHAHDPEVRSFFPEYNGARRHFLSYPDYRPRIRMARFDCAWFGRNGFKILETNTSSPGGSIQNPLVAGLWHAQPEAELFLKGLPDVGDPWAENPYLVIDWALLEAARSIWNDVQTAAVVNLRGVYTNEVDWFVRGLKDRGVRTLALDARDLRYRNGALYHEKEVISLTYNKLDPLALIGDTEAAEYLEAIRSKAVCDVNALSVQLITEDKRVLALLTDPRYEDYLSSEERAAVERHIPWTRRLLPVRTTDPEGDQIDLLDYVRANRERLVVKPANSTRGEGVVIGRRVSSALWEKAIDAGLARPSVVQQYLALPSFDVPLIDDVHGSMRMYLGVDGYIFGGRVAGFQARACPEPVINVAQGGLLLPVVPMGMASAPTKR